MSALAPKMSRYLVSGMLASAIVIACSSEDPDGAGNGTGSVPVFCGTPNEGCDCNDPGAVVDCGTVKQQSGDHVSCSMGSRTCLAGKWGACIGTHIVAKNVTAMGSTIHAAAITQGPCPAPPSPLANVCDPYCNQIIDDGTLVIPGGSGGGSCAWYEAADKNAAYLALNNGWQAARAGNASMVGACSTGTSDPCGHDSWCATGAGCQFFSSGGQNPNCTGANWDLTFGTPCVGTTDTLTICNRGSGATPAAGTYWGVVMAESLQGKPTDVSLCKANPGNVRGYCSINFATTNIPPGACVSAATATLCPGVNFGNSGVPGTDRTTIQWNMPDWPDPNCGNRARVAGECIDKNNFTSYDQNKAVACVGIGCGGGGGGGTTTAGNTEVYPATTTASGITLCGGATNLDNGGAACVPPGYGTCKQDFRCDTATNTCRWNGGSGYFNPGAGGVDLTVGTPCGPGGAVPWTIPICNRGSVTQPPGNVTIHFTNPPAAPNTCGAVASPFPACVVPLPPSGLEPGQCFSTNACPSPGPGSKMVTVNWDGLLPEAAGACANNAAGAKDDGAPGCGACGGCSTSLSGKVYDPSSGLPAIANANNLPLSGISVFQPSGALTPFVDGLACDSCASTDSPKVLNRIAVTDATGSFTLPNVIPGTATRLVVQSGRWRREITVPVTACINNALPAGTLRMPRDRTDGAGGFANVPKTAFYFGNNDPLQCLIRKLGISASEMLPYTGVGNPNRFHIFRHSSNGGQTTVPAAPTEAAAFPLLNNYNQIISGCNTGGAGFDSSPDPDIDRIITWAQGGGRAFLTHGPARSIVRDNPTVLGALAKSTGTWDGKAKSGRTAIVTGTAPNDTFRDWMFNVGGSATFGIGFTDADPKTPFPINPATKATAWLRGTPAPDTGAFMYTFETPINAADCGTPQGLGRVFFSGQHTSGRVTGGNFSALPNNNCDLTTPLIESEKALAFHYFNLSACQLGGAPPPPPPPPLPVTYLVRDYEGICPIGTFPEWQFLYWQSVTLPGTSVEFRAATAATQAALPPSPPAAAPVTVSAGTASGLPVLAPSWASDANTVAWHLQNDPPGPAQLSKQWIRIYARMNPIGAVSPTITALRQDYSCKPAE